MSSMTATTAALAVRNDTAFEPQHWQNRSVRTVAHWGRSGAVIAVEGEIDAANAKPLAEYVQSSANRCEWLVLDLSPLEFIGTAGFSALQAINARCAQADISWALLPGPATTALLRVCDPEGRMPVAESLAAALARVQNPRPQLRAVPEQ